MGVAKKRFNTNVFLKLKNINATPKTPELNKENPNCPGRIKSMVLYSLTVSISLSDSRSGYGIRGPVGIFYITDLID